MRDKFYIASRKELFGSSDDIDDHSVLFPFYEGATNADRIKYRNNSAANWWMRTPNRYNAINVRYVNSSGALNNSGAYNSYGVAPACTIV